MHCCSMHMRSIVQQQKQACTSAQACKKQWCFVQADAQHPSNCVSMHKQVSMQHAERSGMSKGIWHAKCKHVGLPKPAAFATQVVPHPQNVFWGGGQWETFSDNPRPVFGGRPGMGGTSKDLRLGFQLALGRIATYFAVPERGVYQIFLRCEAQCGPGAWGTLTAGPVHSA